MADSWEFLVLVLLFIIPFVLGLFCFLPGKRKNTLTFLWALFVSNILVMMGLLFFRSYSTLQINSLLYFSFSRNALLIALTTNALSGLLFTITAQRKSVLLTQTLVGCSVLALGIANIAFFAGNFPLRYIALELLGLAIAAMIFLHNDTWVEFKNARSIFLFLKFGDLGMLVGILLMHVYTGTLDIQTAFLRSEVLPPSILAWVITGFMVAVLVKMGVWPFYMWLALGKTGTRNGLSWLYTLLMPSLGMYLLYRIAPLMAVNLVFNLVIFYSAAVFMLVMMVLVTLKPRLSNKSLLLNALLGVLALLLTASGSSEVLIGHLIISILIRATLDLMASLDQQSTICRVGGSFICGGLLLANAWPLRLELPFHRLAIVLLAIILLLLSILLQMPLPRRLKKELVYCKGVQKQINWEALLLQTFDLVEKKYFQEGLDRFAKVAMKVLQRIYWLVEVQFLEMLTQWGIAVIRFFERINWIVEVKFIELVTQWGNAFVQFSIGFFETRGFDGGGKQLINTFLQGSEGLKRMEARSFRRDLLWIPLMLFVVILFLIFYPRLDLATK